MDVSNVLVVDDSRVVRVVLKRMLEARGLGVAMAASGQEALDYLVDHVPDVIFMDFMMEGMDGYAATARIRANSRTAAIPVIMCTGNDTPLERARAHECGASDFVTKPISEVALDVLIAGLRKQVVAPRPVAVPAPIPVAAAAVPVPAEDIARIAERIAHDVAERLVREAIAALSAASEQTSRSIAQAAATSATQDAVASLRAEMAKTNEDAEQMAMAAAERIAGTLQRQAADDIEAARRSTETVIDGKLREALASVRTAAEAAAKPIAETAARAVAEEMARTSLVAAREGEAAFRSQLEQRAIAAAEQAAQSVMQQAIEKAEAERASAGAIADETLREAALTAQSTAEGVAREALDSAKAAIESASRQAIESARADLQESVRMAAEAAAKPVAEAAARAVAEEMARNSLVASREYEATLRGELEQHAIAAAERVAQTTVQRAADEAESAHQVAGKVEDEKLREAVANAQSTAERVARETLDSAKAAIEDMSRQAVESARADLQESVRIAAEAAAKPVAEEAARATIEQFARETLAALVEEEAASRRRVEQSAIAVAERVGRELVQLAFSAAASRGQAAAGEADHAKGPCRRSQSDRSSKKVTRLSQNSPSRRTRAPSKRRWLSSQLRRR